LAAPLAKATETIEYLETLLKESDHFASLVEQFCAAKKNADMYSGLLSRELGQLRQKAMARNIGFVADSAGQLAVAASRATTNPWQLSVSVPKLSRATAAVSST
jgi:hypothetical protein